MNARCISPAHAQDQLCLLPNGIQLCYRQYGEAQNPSVLLIAGLGLQLTFWPRLLIDGLVGQGFTSSCLIIVMWAVQALEPHAHPAGWLNFCAVQIRQLTI